MWLVLQPLGLFFPNSFSWGWRGYLGLFVVSAAIALYVARPRHLIRNTLPPSDITITIRVGDVLAQDGNVVIGCNDVFDTQLDDDVISRSSVQGQLLLHVFDGNRDELDRQIDASLAAVVNTPDQVKTFGKNKRYAIGTVAIVKQRRSRYFLVAFTKMSSSLPANVSSTIEGLQVSLARTWEKLAEAGQREPVHMPIIGSNLARLGLSRTLLAQMILLSFIAAETRGRVASDLTLYIRPDDLETIDMAVLDDWLRGLCAR